MARLSEVGERGLVASLLEAFSDGEDVGLGEDAAFLRVGQRYLLLTTDVVNQGTHIPPGATGEQVGWYAAAVSFSDVAAMGGEPFGLLVALTLPPHLEAEYVEDLARGIRSCVQLFDARVLGGDTKEGPEISVCGTALGRTRGLALLRRVGCRPGDVLAVTGALGRAGWAAAHLGEEGLDHDPVDVLLRVHPRVREGLLLAEHGGVTACMDISDGLAASLAQLRAANGVAFRVDYGALPVDAVLDGVGEAERREALLYQGGDYELLFTVAPGAWQALSAALEDHGVRFAAIGEVAKGEGNVLVEEGQAEPLEDRGYEHFRTP